MAADLNHTIVYCRDNRRSSTFLVELLGLDPPVPFGPFQVVQLGNGVSLDYDSIEGDITRAHYSFLVTEDDFDVIFGRIKAAGMGHWADPACTEPGEIYHHNGGRGVYFLDPDAHLLEIQTRPYALS